MKGLVGYDTNWHPWKHLHQKIAEFAPQIQWKCNCFGNQSFLAWDVPSPLLICTKETGLFLTKWPGITLGWPIGLSPHPPQFGCWVVGLRSPVSSKLDPACHTVTDLLPASHSTNRMSVLQRHTHIYTQGKTQTHIYTDKDISTHINTAFSGASLSSNV